MERAVRTTVLLILLLHYSYHVGPSCWSHPPAWVVAGVWVSPLSRVSYCHTRVGGGRSLGLPTLTCQLLLYQGGRWQEFGPPRSHMSATAVPGWAVVVVWVSPLSLGGHPATHSVELNPRHRHLPLVPPAARHPARVLAVVGASPISHITSCHATSHYITSRHVTPRHITSHHVTPHHIMSRHITSCHATSHHVMSCHATP